VRTESIAVLRWIPSTTLAAGEDAVADLLETALAEALHGSGLVASGPFRIRAVQPGEYPEADAGRPDDDPGALLHLAEVAVE
jgi:hypothetical protein